MSEQILSWSTVQTWISKNPHKTLHIAQTSLSTQVAEIPDDELPEWTTSEVSPATPLSCILFLQDATYRNLHESARAAYLRETCTTLQESAALQCKGRQWPVRKTAEGLAEVCLETCGSYSALGLRALAYLQNVQCVYLNEQLRNITTTPEDLRTWSADKEILFLQSDMRAVYHPPKGFGTKNLSQWLSNKEQDGWIVQYPIAEATLSMDELKTLLEKHNEIIPPKSVKETLRKRLGRAQSIRILLNLCEA